jgi:protein O-mannosyl-transferase
MRMATSIRGGVDKLRCAEQPFGRDSWPVFLLFAATLLAYVPALRNGFVFDDTYNITNSLLLRSTAGLGAIWSKVGPARGGSYQYYPLTYSVFWIEYGLFQLRPWGYHLVNILLHALNAVMVWRLLRRLRVPGAILAASIFALHPVHVESVAWITELKNILSGFFYLLSMDSFLRFFEISNPSVIGDAHTRDWRGYIFGSIFFACALAAKTVAATLPAALLLIVWWKTGRVRRRDALLLTPLLALGALAGLLTANVEKLQVGAVGAPWSLTPMQRFLLAGRALWFYAEKLVWPSRLAFIYPYWELNAAIGRQYLFPLTALAVIAVLWGLRDKIGRGPLTAVLFFAGTLAPALGFMSVYFMRYSYVADHFQYLASLGLIVLFSALAASAPRLVSGALLLALGLLTWRQCSIYRTPESLWTDTIGKSPASWIARTNLGVLLADQGRIPEAIEQYRRALDSSREFSETQNDLGVALSAQGRHDEALIHLREAKRLDPRDPRIAHNIAHETVELGLIAAKKGRMDAALANFKAAIDADPTDAYAYDDMAAVWISKHRDDLASDAFNVALRLDPGNLGALEGLGAISLRQGKANEAIAHYHEALRAHPESADVNLLLGILLAGNGDFDEAIECYRRALRIKPDFAAAHQDLGLALVRRGKLEEAIEHFRDALRLQPNYADARYSLSLALSDLSNRSRAK